MGDVSVQTEFANPKLVVIGGGPGGYEAALVASSLGAEVTVIEQQGMGGSAVLTDVVPSKTLIASADTMNRFAEAKDLGVHIVGGSGDGDEINQLSVDLEKVNTRLLRLAATQSRDIKRGLERQGVHLVKGHGRLTSSNTVHVETDEGLEYDLEAQFVLLAVGAYPRELDTAKPDGERIFNWKQVYQMREIPEKLIVVGSGV
ncbi:MAG: NAD(P)H-quinone dehydrogenase, partial [Kocuria rhizophila]